MQSYPNFAEDDASRFLQSRTAKASAAQGVVENYKGLTFVASVEPLLNGLKPRLAAVLWRLPSLMEGVRNLWQSCALEQLNEPVATAKAEPAGRNHDARLVLHQNRPQEVHCRRMP